MSANQLTFPLIGQNTNKSKATKQHHRSVNNILREVRLLHEELNTFLERNPKERPSIRDPKDAYKLLQPFLEHLDSEQMYVLVLDTRNRLLTAEVLYKGTVNSTQTRIAEVFRRAIIENSPAIVVGHNHPSGDPTPSPEDIAITRSIHEAGKLLDIQVLDHLVVGRGSFTSLRGQGLGLD
ncbi:MAG: JAB domain-containing protein [Candidatus Thorarchaeota archaeon]|jgi:DNA repair protein RadC